MLSDLRCLCLTLIGGFLFLGGALLGSGFLFWLGLLVLLGLLFLFLGIWAAHFFRWLAAPYEQPTQENKPPEDEK